MKISRDELFRIVCMIYTQSNNRVGTATFISKNEVPYIVTAAHVAADTDDTSIIIFGDVNNNTYHDSIQQISKTGRWINHPIADLSIMQLDYTKLSKYYKERFLDINDALKEFDISRDVELTVVGFPNGLGTALSGSSKFSPLTFRSFPASNYMTLNRADTSTPSDFFCLENPSMGGYSGGPVFDLGYIKSPVMTQNYGDTMIKGFIHGTMSDNTGGKIALVTPSKYLLDILK